MQGRQTVRRFASIGIVALALGRLVLSLNNVSIGWASCHVAYQQQDPDCMSSAHENLVSLASVGRSGATLRNAAGRSAPIRTGGWHRAKLAS